MALTRTCERCHRPQRKSPTGKGVRWVHTERGAGERCKRLREKDQLKLQLK